MRLADARAVQLAAVQPLVPDSHESADRRGDEVPRAPHIVRPRHGCRCASARRRHADTQQHGSQRVNQIIHGVVQLVSRSHQK